MAAPGVAFAQVGTSILGVSTGDRFGDTVALNGDGTIFAAAAPFRDATNGRDSGQVRVFQDMGNWTQMGPDLVGDSIDDRFGSSLAISIDGLTLAVGTQFFRIDNPNGGVSLREAGLVRVYRFDNNMNWTQIGNDIVGGEEDQAGYAISMSNDGSILAVGEPGFDGSVGINNGRVRIFQNVNDAWVQLGNDVEGEFQSDRLGIAVALNGAGTRVSIGSAEFGFATSNMADTGLVVVYEYIADTQQWNQVGENIPGEVRGDRFGTSVTISEDGTIVAGGAPDHDGPEGNRQGHTRIFQFVSGNWTQVGANIDGEGVTDESGFWIDLTADGSVIAIASVLNNAAEPASVGHVRVFRNAEGNWTQVASDVDGLDRLEDFGRSVKISRDGSVIAAGAPRADNAGTSSGDVRVYQLGL